MFVTFYQNDFCKSLVLNLKEWDSVQVLHDHFTAVGSKEPPTGLSIPCIFSLFWWHVFFAFQHNLGTVCHSDLLKLVWISVAKIWSTGRSLILLFPQENRTFGISGINLSHLGAELNILRGRKCFRASLPLKKNYFIYLFFANLGTFFANLGTCGAPFMTLNVVRIMQLKGLPHYCDCRFGNAISWFQFI
jgi:hypothetical protein